MPRPRSVNPDEAVAELVAEIKQKLASGESGASLPKLAQGEGNIKKRFKCGADMAELVHRRARARLSLAPEMILTRPKLYKQIEYFLPGEEAPAAQPAQGEEAPAAQPSQGVAAADAVQEDAALDAAPPSPMEDASGSELDEQQECIRQAWQDLQLEREALIAEREELRDGWKALEQAKLEFQQSQSASQQNENPSQSLVSTSCDQSPGTPDGFIERLSLRLWRERVHAARQSGAVSTSSVVSKGSGKRRSSCEDAVAVACLDALSGCPDSPSKFIEQLQRNSMPAPRRSGNADSRTCAPRPSLLGTEALPGWAAQLIDFLGGAVGQSTRALACAGRRSATWLVHDTAQMSFALIPMARELVNTSSWDSGLEADLQRVKRPAKLLNALEPLRINEGQELTSLVEAARLNRIDCKLTELAQRVHSISPSTAAASDNVSSGSPTAANYVRPTQRTAAQGSSAELATSSTNSSEGAQRSKPTSSGSQKTKCQSKDCQVNERSSSSKLLSNAQSQRKRRLVNSDNERAVSKQRKNTSHPKKKAMRSKSHIF